MQPGTRPSLGVTDGDVKVLSRVPIEVALVEIRFTAPDSEVTSADAESVRNAVADALGVDLPAITPATQRSIEISSPSAEPSVQVLTSGYSISASDGTVQVTILKNVVTLQVTRYERWEASLRPGMEAVTRQVEDLWHPTLVNRIGLRYIDRLQEPSSTTTSDWRDRIAPSLLGVLDNETFGDLIRGTQQILDLSWDAGHGALLRHGSAPVSQSGPVHYLLDIDVFDQVAGAYRASDVIARSDELNKDAYALFAACLTEKYLSSLERSS